MSRLCSSRILRRKELAKRLGVSEVTVWRWASKGALPPKRRVGPNVVGWLESEIEWWWAEQSASVSASAVHVPKESDHV